MIDRIRIWWFKRRLTRLSNEDLIGRAKELQTLCDNCPLKKRAGKILTETLMMDGMTGEDVDAAFELSQIGHDIAIVFLSEDEDDTEYKVMVSWVPMTEEEAHGDEDMALYGNWKDVVTAHRSGSLNQHVLGEKEA